MELIRNTNIDFLGKRKIGFFLSATLIIIGLVSLGIHNGPNFGIDFRGGVKIRAKFNRAVTEKELKSKLAQLGYDRPKIQVDDTKKEASIDIRYLPEFEDQKIIVRLASDPGDATATNLQIRSTEQYVHLFQSGDVIQLVEGEKRARNEIRAIVERDDLITLELAKPTSVDFTPEVEVQMQASAGRALSDVLLRGDADWHALPQGVNVSEVGPSVGKDLKWAALWSILWSIVILLMYISWRFEFRFAVGAIAALLHDVLITLGIFSLLVKEINLPTVAAFLTIIGYSLNDTIVVYDRIRENTNLFKGMDNFDIINQSINQSLSRTIITSLTTFFVVLTIFVLSSPGEEINTFAFALIVGVVIGTYSSIFVASPILHMWLQRKQRQTA